MSLTRLVSYQGDSEISDSEDERVESTSPIAEAAVQGLGIPLNRVRVDTPPVSGKPLVIQPAPSFGLVAYYDEEEDPNESREMETSAVEFVVDTDMQIEAPLPTSAPTESDVVINEPAQDELEDTDPVFLPLFNVELPPEPTGQCSSALQEKIIAMLEKKKRGINLNSNVQRRKDFRNPSIYEKLVQFCNIDEFGSNYPPELFDPHKWEESSYHDNLLRIQKKAYEKKEKAKLDRTKVEFVTGTRKSSLPGGSQEAVKKQRKTKWDVGGAEGHSPSAERSGVGAQAIAHASQMNKELSKLGK